MDLLEECKKRQAELLLILGADQDELWAGDEITAERLRQSARTAISQYEKIIHMLNGDQVGHA